MTVKYTYVGHGTHLLDIDGTKVVIDSPHGGNGRQMYLIDISERIKFDKKASKSPQ